MSKGNKLKESSLASDIKGFLSTAKLAIVRKVPKENRKKKNTEKPWYLKSLNEIKQEVIGELSMLKEASAEEIKARELELQKQMLRTKFESDRDPSDIGKEEVAKSAKKAYEDFMSLSPEEKADYQRFSIDPKLTRATAARTQKDTSAAVKRSDVNPQIAAFIGSEDTIQALDVVDKDVRKSIYTIVNKYLGAEPTREEEYSAIKNFVENTLYKEYGGSIQEYIKDKSKIWRNISLGEIKDEKLKKEIEDEMVENNIRFRGSYRNFQDWTVLSKPLQKKIKDYYEKETEPLKHKIRSQFAKLQIPTMSVSQNVKRTQSHNPYTKSKQKDDESEEK